MKKKNTPAYLAFTRKERVGISVILSLVFVFALLPFLYPVLMPRKQESHETFEKEIAALEIKQADSAHADMIRNAAGDAGFHYYPSSVKHEYGGGPAGELFYFDPNTLPAAGWKKLGLREKTIATIQNYLSRGGKFREPGDIGKIWGLHDDEVKRLLPFVSIVNPSPGTPSDKKAYENKSFPRKEDRNALIDINKADSSALIALPGIGSRLAQRIITFREKLGGFNRVEQVAETYALPDSTFQKIRPRLFLKDPELKRIDINKASVDEMKTHPYIRFALANAIVQYRQAHGKFLAVKDIRKIMMVTDETYNKLEAYLSAN